MAGDPSGPGPGGPERETDEGEKGGQWQEPEATEHDGAEHDEENDEHCDQDAHGNPFSGSVAGGTGGRMCPTTNSLAYSTYFVKHKLTPGFYGFIAIIKGNFMPNRSPWIHQLNHERRTQALSMDLKTDVAVIGAGIAGVATTFYLLKHTDKRVALIEAYKLAHGATGHNAGQLVDEFERPFADIVKEFGLEMACRGQRDLKTAWELLEEIYTEAGANIFKSEFEGYTAFSNLEKVLEYLEDGYLLRQGGFYFAPIMVWEDWPELSKIPEKYHKQILLVSREEIALKIESFDPQYIGVYPQHMGVMNSALFCQEVVSYLSLKYPERFQLFEHTPIGKVVIHEDRAILDAEKHTVVCEKVVLCTNGFENFDILTHEGLAVNSRFHHNINGVVAFMSGYLEPHTGQPMANKYFQPKDIGLTDNPGDPYFYVTRRSYQSEQEGKNNLICVGGPDFSLEDRSQYDREQEFSEIAGKQIGEFLHQAYDKKMDQDYHFLWHGLMGYTKNLLRMIGPDPEHSQLYYNLGCNGVGLIPSIYGGYKVARQIAGEKFEPSIFDIPKQ